MTARERRGLSPLLAAVCFMAGAAVSCGLDSKVNELINPPVPGTVPTAAIAVDSDTVGVGTTIQLDASGSSDPQGKTLTYAWTLEVPKGSLSALSSSTAAITSFTPDKGGQYLVSVTVTNSSSIASGSVTAQINAVGTGSNYPPVAITTSALTGTVGSAVVLDGSDSYDADQQSLTYTWTMIGAPSTSSVTSLDSSSSQFASFTPDATGTYNVKLVVSDGTDSDQALVTVTVSAQTVESGSATVPTASFTVDNSTVMVGTPVLLDATASSDPQGLALTYAWTLKAPEGSSATIGSATSMITSFTPDKGGAYLVYLTVTNSSSIASEAATARVDAVGTGSNYPPVAITTAAVTGTVNSIVVLDGSDSYDADQQSLTYTWTMIGVPSTSAVTALTDSSLKTAYFTPDVAGTYTVSFVVSDGTDSDQALVTVTVSAQALPTASFTVDNATVVVGTPVLLDATASSDPEGLALTYAWSLEAPKGSLSTVGSATSAATSFTPDEGGVYLVYLTVTNSAAAASAPVTALVNAVGTGSNHPPVAITTAAVTGAINSIVILDGSQSYDADQQGLTYTWTVISAPTGSAVTALTDSALNTAYFMPDVAGTYVIKFVVSDGTDSDQVFVTVTAA